MTDNTLTYEERREAYARGYADWLYDVSQSATVNPMIERLPGPTKTYAEFLADGRAEFDAAQKRQPRSRYDAIPQEPTENGSFTDLIGEDE